LPAVGEWIADAPPQVLERLGVRPGPLLPKRLLPAEVTVRRLPSRIDGDAPDRSVGRRLADRRGGTVGAAPGSAAADREEPIPRPEPAASGRPA